MTPVETLEAAADRLEKLIAAVAPGPWEADTSEIYADGLVWVGETLNTDDPERTAAHSAYIAAMNPLVGRELVAILRGTAAGIREGRWPGGPPMQRVAGLLLGESLDRVPGEFKTITEKEN